MQGSYKVITLLSMRFNWRGNLFFHRRKNFAKTLDMIQLLQDNGYQLREPYLKALENGIFELRIKLGNNISRIMYFFYVDQHIILTNGFIKKTQKTPRNEIEKAKKYRADYMDRKESYNE